MGTRNDVAICEWTQFSMKHNKSLSNFYNTVNKYMRMVLFWKENIPSLGGIHRLGIKILPKLSGLYILFGIDKDSTESTDLLQNNII